MNAKRLQNKPQQTTGWVKGLGIGQDWRVGADALNIILYQRHVNKKTGKEYWRAHSYYATVTNAMVGLVNQGVRDTELADLKTVCDKIDQLRRDILKVCADPPLPHNDPALFIAQLPSGSFLGIKRTAGVCIANPGLP